MTPLIEKLAIKAGFNYDPSDCNFYGEEGWQNSYIIALSREVAKSCLDAIEQSQGDLDFAVWKIKQDFRID